MKESGALHRLIHSLTKNEKRHFTLLASSNRDSSDYLKIFKAIDEQPLYNERLLKAELNAGEELHHFAVKKNQLYLLLLRSLRTYHEGRTFDTTLKEMMQNASILSDKALYRECYAILNRAREIARHYEDWKIQLEIIHRRFTILFQLSDWRQAEKEAALMGKEDDTVLAHLNNYGLIGKLNIQLALYLKIGAAKNKDIEKLMHHPVLQSERNALSFRSKSLYCVIWSSYYIHKNQFAKATVFLKKHISLYEKFPQFIEASPGNYLSAMKDLLEMNFRLRRFDEATKLIQQLNQLAEHSHVKKFGTRRFRQFIFSWTFRIEISMAIQSASLQKINSRVDEQSEYFSRIENAIEPLKRIETRLAFAAFYFFYPDHKKSVHHVGKIFSDKEISRYPIIQLHAMLLHWFIHFEEGDIEMIKYLYSPILRQARKQKNLPSTQKLMVELIEKLLDEPISTRRKAQFVLFERRFLQLKKSAADSYLYDYFDITLWIKK